MRDILSKYRFYRFAVYEIASVVYFVTALIESIKEDFQESRTAVAHLKSIDREKIV